jgi:ADP-ribose pyrophosphatase YjhB (NUDIX family)
MRTVICRNLDGSSTKPIPIEKLVFRPSIYGVIIRNNKILLVPQWDGYDFPGGGIDKGETNEHALLREVKEETGLSVKIQNILLCEEDFFKDFHEDDAYYHSILLYYLCSNPTGKLSTKGFDEQEKEYAKLAQWVPIDQISNIKFYNSIDNLALIKKATANQVK